jgi:NitT/TauT family transport system substrate-binding protein
MGRRVAIVVAALAGILAIGVVLFSNGVLRFGSGMKSEPRRITIAQAGDFFLYAPLYVARDAGFLASEGIEVDIISTGGDDKTWAAVIGGSASFGLADPTFVAVSAQRGEPGRVIASVVNGVPFWGVTKRADIPPLQNGKGLRGLSVATFPSPSTAYALQKQMFDDAGVPARIVQGSFGTLLAMLEAKRADIALELEPNVSQAVSQGARVVYSLAEQYGDFAITGLTASPALLQADSTLAYQTVCAIQRALDFIRINPDSTLSLLRRRFPSVDSAVARQALARVISDRIIPESAIVSPVAWGKAIALRVRSGDLGVAPAIDDVVDLRFAKRAESQCRLSR